MVVAGPIWRPLVVAGATVAKSRFDFIVYQSDLAEVIAGELSGDFKRVFVAQLHANREEDPEVDMEKVKKDAQDLYDVRWNLSNFVKELKSQSLKINQQIEMII